jgi:hypothetical protein
MISDAAALVMFAIRSSIKLGLELRQAFVDNTKRRDLVLPLPNFFSAPDIVSAANYFAGPPGSAYLATSQKLADLLTKRRSPGLSLTPDEEAEVLTYYDEFFNLDLAKAGRLGAAGDGTTLTADQFNALITVRQWQRGSDPNPSTLQRVAGTFIEIGIDYFTSVPGALNQDSRQGKAIAGFLDAMSEINFSDEQLGQIPGRLFTAALDTISENSDLLSADPKVQELVKVTTKSLSANVASRLQQLGGSDLTKAQQIGDWAELVFRSVLSSAGGLVLSDPKRFLGIQQAGQAALVTSVGDSVLGLVLGDSGVQLDRLFSRQGLETVTKSALTVLGQHPEILVQSNNLGLQKLLGAIATQLSQYDTLLTPDMLPEITRMILEKTGENLPLLWPDLANNPQQHLLLTAASVTLGILTRKPDANQKWTLQFSSADLLTVVNAVLDELAANPTWLLNDAGQVNDNLKIALDAALGVIRNRADERLSTATAIDVLSAVVVKVGMRREFLDLMPAGTAAAGQTLISAALDAIFGTIFDPTLDAKAAWQVVRSQIILDLVNLSLAELAKVPLAPAKLDAFAAFIKQQAALLAAGTAWDPLSFTTKLQQALTA